MISMSIVIFHEERTTGLENNDSRRVNKDLSFVCSIFELYN